MPSWESTACPLIIESGDLDQRARRRVSPPGVCSQWSMCRTTAQRKLSARSPCGDARRRRSDVRDAHRTRLGGSSGSGITWGSRGVAGRGPGCRCRAGLWGSAERAELVALAADLLGGFDGLGQAQAISSDGSRYFHLEAEPGLEHLQDLVQEPAGWVALACTALEVADTGVVAHLGAGATPHAGRDESPALAEYLEAALRFDRVGEAASTDRTACTPAGGAAVGGEVAGLVVACPPASPKNMSGASTHAACRCQFGVGIGAVVVRSSGRFTGGIWASLPTSASRTALTRVEHLYGLQNALPYGREGA